MSTGIVNVLISTYNGEKYIREQIDSVLAQTWPHIRIYVRDDGSSDGTLEILREYAKEGRIRVIRGKNVGYGRSFGRLLKAAEEGDYWAFCDQDDVWLPEKVEWAVHWLEKQPQGLPALFGSAYELTDETLQETTGCVLPPNYKLDFRRSLTECVYMGFVMTFNRPLRELMLAADMDEITSHDWWAQILAQRYGVHHFDPRIAARHRRLDTSISGMNMKNRIKWMLNTFQTGETGTRSCARAYDKTFGRFEKDSSAAYASWFTGYRYHPGLALKKALYPARWRPVLSSEIIYRMLMLLGKI